MAIKKTLQIGNKVVRVGAKVVADFTSPKIAKVIQNLVDTMRQENLVGMAAPQIGEGMRIFVSEIRKTKFRKNIKELGPLRIFINPVITNHSKEKVDGYEGCGSVASSELFGKVARAKSITVEAYNADSKKFQLRASGFLARIIQHEVDHLDGILFIDRIKDTHTLLGREEFLIFQRRK